MGKVLVINRLIVIQIIRLVMVVFTNALLA